MSHALRTVSLRWPQPLTRKIMSDYLKEFISEALCQPSDYVTYFASVKLAEMYPGAAIIESESWAFNLPEYAEAGLCSVWRHEAIHGQSKTYCFPSVASLDLSH